MKNITKKTKIKKKLVDNFYLSMVEPSHGKVVIC